MGEPPVNGALRWGHDLIPLGEEFYEVSDCALDGSWLEIRRYAGPLAAIGRTVPDFRMTDSTGRTFELHDYRGRYLLLDFWPSWCAPCVREFANIKAVVQSHADRQLSVISVNLDTEKALPVARKVIADQALPWPQVLEGRGYFFPAYQVLGRLPEERGVFPLYVIIEPDGRVGYATNDFLKMRRFLDAAFAPAASRRDGLFVPLSAPRVIPPGEPLPVDFTDASLGTVRTDPRVKLPRDLPDEARIGRLPNGVLVVVRRDAAGQMWIRVDINADRDLTDHEDVRIPILGRAPVAPDEAPAVRMNLPYASGARSFRPFRFFAQPSADGGPPQVFYIGWKLEMSGTFVRDGIEYAVSISDPTADLIFTDEDAKTAGFLTLKRKQDISRVNAGSGAEDLVIGGKRFRLVHVHDDGELVELERVIPPGVIPSLGIPQPPRYCGRLEGQ
jgi:peroxiredoxin